MNQFIDAWKDAVLKNYANFAGRLSVAGYWQFFAVNIAISVALYILTLIVDVFFIIYILYSLAVLIPGIAAAVRRLHDTGKPGVYVLVGLIPCVGWILLIYWLVQASVAGPNDYGPQPV